MRVLEEAIVIGKKRQTLTVQISSGETLTESFFSTAGAEKIKNISEGDSIQVLVNLFAHAKGSTNAAIEKIIFHNEN